MSYDGKCQLLVIGDSMVGKTSLLYRFTNGTFDAHYLATVGLDNFTKDEIINNKKVRIKIWDTAGQEKFQSLTKGFFRNAQGIMIVFDVSNIETYDNIKYWAQSIKTHMGSEIEKIPVIIIGNKMDLKERKINKNDAEIYSTTELGYPYFETSAKTGENVDNTVKYLVKEVLKKNKKNKFKTSNNDTYTSNNIKIKKNTNEGNCPC
jgi:small GTP-binding protein